MVKTRVVSSAVPEEIEKWIKDRAKREGVSPSLWIATLITYTTMIDGMTKGEIPAIIHDLLHVRDFINKEFDFNPFNRFQKKESKGKTHPAIQEKA